MPRCRVGWPSIADRPDSAALQPAVDALAAGEVVAFPTDTLYGLAVDPRRSDAARRLFAVKRRPAGVAVPLIAADVGQIELVVRYLTPLARRMADRWWPGPVSIVLDALPGLDPRLVDAAGTVALRVPAHPLARRLAECFNHPITATSANRSGESPATEAGCGGRGPGERGVPGGRRWIDRGRAAVDDRGRTGRRACAVAGRGDPVGPRATIAGVKGSAVAARHAVARERVVIVGLQPNLLTGGEAESSKALFVTLDPLRKAAGALLAAALLVGGCAVRVPVVTTPAFPDFVFPAAPASYAESPAADEQRDAWAFLQAGDLAQAETRFAALLARDAAFFPALPDSAGWISPAADTGTRSSISTRPWVPRRATCRPGRAG